jgi:hypothetical protein
MSPAEFEARLNSMDEHQFAEFKKNFGGDMNRAGYVQDYIRNQTKFEPILCRILKMPTESDKQGVVDEAGLLAAQRQASEATRANELSTEANRISRQANSIAFWACVLSAIALVVSVVAVIVALYKP